MTLPGALEARGREGATAPAAAAISRAPKGVTGSTRVGLAAGAALLALYLASLAPDVTFWDAGEFIAAARTLGIPHPPGTPLFVLLTHVWARLLWFLPTPVATNTFSALCTAAAGGLTAAWLARATADRWAGAAAAVCAGCMSSVWLNATETEVYAASLALAVVALWCGDRAGRASDARARGRRRILLGYLIVLAIPLHMSALVAMPAAAFLASRREDGVFEWGSAVALLGTIVAAAGLGLMSPVIGGAGVALVAASPAAPALSRTLARRVRRPTGDGTGPEPIAGESAGRLAARALAIVFAGAVAATALLFLLLRARLDPPINQGNPADWHALTDVVARRQYPPSPMWPRNAPFWLQLGNMFEWADWQSALALAPGVIPTVGRVAATVVFVVLGVEGCLAHRRRDPRSWWTLAILTLCGSLGVVVYLNLHLGPSFGYGFVPADAVREARERDYFFVLGFWGWGAWAGIGATSLVRSRGWRPVLGLVVAASPALLNWSAVERRREPEASLPHVFADALLGAAPPRGVLFVAGDNDSYPLWEAQQVRGVRRDVTVVTLPLLPAAWYQQEMARRARLLDPAAVPMDPHAAATESARRARSQGRPVAVAATVDSADRRRLGRVWIVRGPVYVAADSATRRDAAMGPVAGGAIVGDTVLVDSAATRAWARRIAIWRRGRTPGESVDPAPAYSIDVLACPAWILAPSPTPAQRRSLASICNLR